MKSERPLVVGLTGSIGMGKTETARMFAQLGIPVHDADAAVHRLYESHPEVVCAVAEAFPDCVREGRVDRACLAAHVRNDDDAFRRLEEIIHPLVAADQLAFIEQAAREGADLVILDVPLLFETGGDQRIDAVVVVSAPLEAQRARVLARPGMSEGAFTQILARQMPNAEKRARADFVVETGEGLDRAFAQVKSIVASLRTRSAQTVQSIGDFRTEVQRLLDVLARNIDDDYYPRNVHGIVLTFSQRMPVTFDFPIGDATPFVELRNGQFHFVISERGSEVKRFAGNPDEVLALLFEGITFELAGQFELRHRVKGQDSRRLLFSKQIELLKLLNPQWAESRREQQLKILRTYPFNDSVDNPV